MLFRDGRLYASVDAVRRDTANLGCGNAFGRRRNILCIHVNWKKGEYKISVQILGIQLFYPSKNIDQNAHNAVVYIKLHCHKRC